MVKLRTKQGYPIDTIFISSLIYESTLHAIKRNTTKNHTKAKKSGSLNYYLDYPVKGDEKIGYIVFNYHTSSRM